MSEIICADAFDALPKIPRGSVHCCVTSPPYFGLRDYKTVGQIGLEKDLETYVRKLQTAFCFVYGAMRDDGTLWLNMGDTYKNKDLMGVPWKVAFALQSAGWILRQDIIWQKPNAMPESVRDRFTKSHEYIFLFTKSRKYYFDHAAAQEPVRSNKGCARTFRGGSYVKGSAFENDGEHKRNSVGNVRYGGKKYTENPDIFHRTKSGSMYITREERNIRDVWEIATQGYKGAHFATFPYKLAERCIRVGCPAGGVVLDPFAGSGTTLEAAQNLGREYIGIEINPEYIKLIEERLGPEQIRMEDLG